jgi:hypothetical protein
MNLIINYCSALSGAGKTHEFINMGCELAKRGERPLIFQPTIELIERTIEQELCSKRNPPPHRKFHGDVLKGSVAKAITEFSQKGDVDGTFVFSTHQVLPRIGHLENKDQFHVLIDEELQVHGCNSFKVPDTHSLLTDHLELKPYNSIYSEIVVKNGSKIDAIAKNKNEDQIYEEFRDLAQLLDNRHWSSYVNAELYQKLLDERGSTLTVHSVLNPSVLKGFASVTMASALFEHSLVYQLWGQAGVKFIEDNKFKLRFNQHDNGRLITIKYGDERQWSRKRRESNLAANEVGTPIPAGIAIPDEDAPGANVEQPSMRLYTPPISSSPTLSSCSRQIRMCRIASSGEMPSGCPTCLMVSTTIRRSITSSSYPRLIHHRSISDF